MKLSCCIATYQENANIHYALDSVIEWVDEIVIVDGGSTDGTVQKVLSYGTKIKLIQTTNPPMFHINKQKALDAASAEWILQLDADEEVTPALRREIIAHTQDIQSNDAYWIPRLNYFLGRFLRKGGVYPDYTIRLYKRGRARYPCKDLHENVVITGTVGYCTEPLQHYSDPVWSRYIARWHRYCKAEAVRLRDTTQSKHNIHMLLLRPIPTFLNTYIRHKGILDGWQGFVFHGMSALRWFGIWWYYRIN